MISALIIIPLIVLGGIYIWKEKQWGIYSTSMSLAYKAIEKDDFGQACQEIDKALSAKSIENMHRTHAESLKKECEKANSIDYLNQIILGMDENEFLNYIKFVTITKRYFESDFVNDAFIRKLSSSRKEAPKIREKLLFDISEKKRIEKEQAEKTERDRKEKEIAEEKARVIAKAEEDKKNVIKKSNLRDARWDTASGKELIRAMAKEAGVSEEEMKKAVNDEIDRRGLSDWADNTKSTGSVDHSWVNMFRNTWKELNLKNKSNNIKHEQKSLILKTIRENIKDPKDQEATWDYVRNIIDSW